MKCKYERCKKELPEGHKRIYCDNKCMADQGLWIQAERNKEKMTTGICIKCGELTYRTGRYTPRFCDKLECQKVFAEESRTYKQRKNKARYCKNKRETAKQNRYKGGSILNEDGSIQEYYLTRGDPFRHGITSKWKDLQ